MARLGGLLLQLHLVVAAIALAVAVAATTRPALLPRARRVVYGTAALAVAAALVLAYCLVAHDFSIRYVAQYSDRSMTWPYLVAALWAGQNGSLLFWCVVLDVYTVVCVRWLERRQDRNEPLVIAVLMAIATFFAVLVVLPANPFEAFWTGGPSDGDGLNPLLQNAYMVFHPPALYLGFIGYAVPFAFALAALLSGRLDDEWLRSSRRWSLAAWIFLTLGNVLGAVWAYEELGWGGYWAWDPVENASFLPWLLGTAFLHSAMVQERRRSFRAWNVILPIVVFALTIFGTFLTRSGVVSSIHGFAQSEVGPFFLWFLVGLVAFCVALLAWRWRALRRREALDSLLSREGAFLVGNWVFVVATVVVLALTSLPLVTQWAQGRKATVGPAFFTFFILPIALAVVALIGLGTLARWRKSTLRGLLSGARGPAIAGGLAGVVVVAFGSWVRFPPFVEILPDVIDAVRAGWLRWLLRVLYGVTPVTAVVVIVFALTVVLRELWTAARARRASTGERTPLALVRVVGRARRHYGGMIVHAGFVLMVFGMLGGAFRTEVEAAVRPGQSIRIWDYRAKYEGLEARQDARKQMLFARLRLERAGAPAGTLQPGKYLYRSHPETPTSEMAFRTSLRDDLDAILGTVDARTESATIKLVVNPLTLWLWVGAIVLLFGATVAVWPPPVPAESASTRARGRASAEGRAALALAQQVLAAHLRAVPIESVVRGPLACPSCGAALDADSLFCKKCGAKVASHA